MTREDHDAETEQEDPIPLTDEEYAELKKKERRVGGIISAIFDFITSFFS